MEKVKKIVINNESFEFELDNQKHLNGYLYDSLCYRYIRAREQMADYEYLRDCQSCKHGTRDWMTYRERANRDIMRFCEILHEAIGEHD